MRGQDKAKPLGTKPQICTDLLCNLEDIDTRVSLVQEGFRILGGNTSSNITLHFSAPVLKTDHKVQHLLVPRLWCNTSSRGAKDAWLVPSGQLSALTERLNSACDSETFLLIKINYYPLLGFLKKKSNHLFHKPGLIIHQEVISLLLVRLQLYYVRVHHRIHLSFINL